MEINLDFCTYKELFSVCIFFGGKYFLFTVIVFKTKRLSFQPPLPSHLEIKYDSDEECSSRC